MVGFVLSDINHPLFSMLVLKDEGFAIGLGLYF